MLAQTPSAPCDSPPRTCYMHQLQRRSLLPAGPWPAPLGQQWSYTDARFPAASVAEDLPPADPPRILGASPPRMFISPSALSRNGGKITSREIIFLEVF